MSALSRWHALVPPHDDDDDPGRDRWIARAADFDAAAPPDAALPVELGVLESDVVLDIGAGTGRHTLPLAQRCRQVIAVEPSAAMRARLVDKLGPGVRNVQVIAARWPMPDPPRADVVFSSHVLYGVRHVDLFLLAMTSAARRRCVLALGLCPPSSALDGLRLSLGLERRSRPGADAALEVLGELGFDARRVVLDEPPRPVRVGRDDAALARLARRLYLEPSPSTLARLRDALARTTPEGPDGAYELGEHGPDALVIWEP